MPFDSFPERIPSGGNWGSQQCSSCKRPIASHEPVEEIRLPHDPVNGAHKVNDIYHADCAKPYVSLVGVLNVLSRWG